MKRNIHILNKIILLAACLGFTSCADWFQGKIAMDSEANVTDLAELFNYSGDTVVLSAPEQVFASEEIYADKIIVSWKEVENASSYVIERAIVQPDEQGNYSVPEEEEFSVLNSFVYKTTYTDQILSSPSYDDSEYSYKYYYRICAQNIGEGYVSSDFTDISNDATNACGSLFSPPQNVVAWKGKSTSEIQVTWTQSSSDSANLEKYEIYRGIEEDGSSMELIDTINASSSLYSDEISTAQQGTEFYYKIVAVNSYSEKSAKSSIAMGYSLTEGAPVAPENVKVVDGYGTSKKSLKISWDSVSASENSAGETPTVYYNIYRSSSADSVVSLIKSRTTDTSYVDSAGLKTGLYYYYYVMTIASYESGEQKSGFSDSGSDSTSPAMGFILSPPTTLSVQEDDSLADGKVYLKWKPAIGSEIDGISYSYSIWISSSLTETFTRLTDVIEFSVDSDGYIFYEIAKYNYYKIATLNSENLESELSSAAAPHPSAPTNVCATKNAQFSEDWSANTNGVYPVKITWDAPQNESPYAYTVYRSTSCSSGFKKVATTSETYLVDSNSSAKAGEMYYYKVISLNIQSQGSHSNDPSTDTEFNCRGYGAITADQWFREYNKTVMHSQSKLTLMHKSNDMDKLGSETVNGDISGSLTYKSSVAGLGAEIKMPYTNYSDFYASGDGTLYLGNINGNGSDYNSLSDDEKSRCVEYFILNGSTDTSCNMSANGSMSNSVDCKGMYPGIVYYDNLKIVSGAAGDGYYLVTTYDNSGNTILSNQQVSWEVGEESTGYGWGE